MLFSIKINGQEDTKITKTAPISLGVTEQTFDLDIGALTGQVSATLQIEEVLVSAGQQVQKGTALFRITSNSAQNVRTILQREILDTSRDCELLEAKQRELRLQASQEYDNDLMDGKYANVIYNNKCDALQKKVDDAKQAVDDQQNEVNENLLELTQTQQELVKAQKYLKDAEAAVSENYNNRYDNAYYYTTYERTRETAQNMVDQLEKQIESLTKKNDFLLYEVDEALRAYHQIVQELEKEKLAVKMDYDTEIYDSKMASEWYEIQMTSLDNALQEARERYQTALQNIRLFDAYIVQNQIRSRHSGVLTDIMVEAGNTVCKNDRLVALYDQKAVTMQVPVSEEEYLAINQEEAVAVSLTEDPDKVYEGRITEVLSKECGNSSKKTCYFITVTIQGDVSGFYEGMTGDIVFLTV